jgi:hypothetical protein
MLAPYKQEVARSSRAPPISAISLSKRNACRRRIKRASLAVALALILRAARSSPRRRVGGAISLKRRTRHAPGRFEPEGCELEIQPIDACSALA